MRPGSCARTTGARSNGTAAALPTSVMNSRRFTDFLPTGGPADTLPHRGPRTVLPSQQNRPLMSEMAHQRTCYDLRVSLLYTRKQTSFRTFRLRATRRHRPDPRNSVQEAPRPTAAPFLEANNAPPLVDC